MAEIHGKGGGVTSTGGDVTVNSWTLSYVGDAVECTNFDSTGGREYIVGLTGWSGSYDCFFSTTGNTLTPGSSGTIVLTISTGTGAYGFRGSVIITGMDVTAPVDGVITQTYTFQGTNALSSS